jgi:hypothetical protein
MIVLLYSSLRVTVVTSAIIIAISLGNYTFSQTQNCCNEAACKETAQKLAQEAAIVMAPLGSDPNDEELRRNKVENLQKNSPAAYAKIVHHKKSIKKWAANDGDKINCLMSFITNMEVLDWLIYLALEDSQIHYLSPEFCRGWALQADINQGAVDLFTSSEGFSSSARLLLAYTLSTKNTCGGRIRLLLGPSLYYQDRKTLLLLNPRVEIRLFDLANELISIGNIKLITQANVNREHLIGGIGIGAELYNVGIQLLGELQQGENRYSIQTGIFYRFNFARK